MSPEIFDDLLGEALAYPSPHALSFFAERRCRGGGVGYDEHGRLVRGLPGGKLADAE